jgi:UDP-glucose 4-epimerase
MDKKILITGGTGFIGSNLVNYLSKNNKVKILDNNFRGKNSSIQINKNIKVINGDIRNIQIIKKAIKDVDIVIHLAFINGTRNFYKKASLVLDVGLGGTYNLIKSINNSKNKIKLFIYASSSEIYQTPKIIPTDENVAGLVPDIKNPRYSYGSAKLIGEILTFHMLKKNIKRIIFRPHNIYGPNMGKLHVIPELILKIKKQIKKNSINLKIQGSGKETRAFCYIDDAINAINLIIKKGQDGEIYNIGNDKEISINNLVNMISKILKKKIYIKKGVLRKGSTKRRCPNIKKIKKIGFLPKVQMNEGLIKTLNYYL